MSGEQVKSGYKCTEVGVIPNSWGVSTISQSMRLINGRSFKPHDWRKQGTPIIRIQNLNDPTADFNYFDGDIDEKNLVLKGDVLFAWSGTLGSSFGARIWSGPDAVLNQHIFKVIADERVFTKLFSYLIFKRVQEDIEKKSHGFKSSFVHVKKADIDKIKLPIPPLAEQHAIADAMSDVDSLLARLDQQIAKKRDLKQAAMQQLLTGQTRLPGFSGEWVVKRLGDVCPLQRGFDLLTTKLRKGIYPVVYSNGVLNHHDEFMIKGPGVVTGRSGTIGNVHYVEKHYWPHNTSLWVTNFKGNSPKFIFYLLGYLGLERFGTGSGVPTLNRNDVHAHSVMIPVTANEQTAIASVLSDMDAELAALDARREKTRALKQGMMQELLTGRVRLLTDKDGD